jgi:hypothetical protein
MHVEHNVLFIPQLGMLVANTSKKMNHCFVDNLCLSIGLWMEMSYSSLAWCPSFSTSLSKTLQGIESLDLRQWMWVVQNGPIHAERKDEQSAQQ